MESSAHRPSQECRLGARPMALPSGNFLGPGPTNLDVGLRVSTTRPITMFGSTLVENQLRQTDGDSKGMEHDRGRLF